MRKLKVLLVIAACLVTGVVLLSLVAVPRMRDDQSFASATNAATASSSRYEDAIAAYESYLAAYPKGRHADAATTKITKDLPTAIDEREWTSAKGKDTTAAYEAYLASPFSRNGRAEAETAILARTWTTPPVFLPPPSRSPSNDISIAGLFSHEPIAYQPDEERGSYHAQPGGIAMPVTTLSFDPGDTANGLAYTFQGGEAFWGSTVDGGRLEEHRIEFADLCTPDGQTCAAVGLYFGAHRKLSVSDSYVVTPVAENQARTEQRAQRYCAAVVFWPKYGIQRVSGGVLVVSRCGGTPVRIPLQSPPYSLTRSGSHDIIKAGYPAVYLSDAQRRTDTVTWSIERSGRVSLKGVVGFPVVGTLPNLVYYLVDIE